MELQQSLFLPEFQQPLPLPNTSFDSQPIVWHFVHFQIPYNLFLSKNINDSINLYQPFVQISSNDLNIPTVVFEFEGAN